MTRQTGKNYRLLSLSYIKLFWFISEKFPDVILFHYSFGIDCTQKNPGVYCQGLVIINTEL